MVAEGTFRAVVGVVAVDDLDHDDRDGLDLDHEMEDMDGVHNEDVHQDLLGDLLEDLLGIQSVEGMERGDLQNVQSAGDMDGVEVVAALNGEGIERLQALLHCEGMNVLNMEWTTRKGLAERMRKSIYKFSAKCPSGKCFETSKSSIFYTVICWVFCCNFWWTMDSNR